MIEVSHFGDIGDIIYAGPLFKAIAKKGNGKIALTVYPDSAPRVRQTAGSIEPLFKLLRVQDYIGLCQYSAQPNGTVLDAWRRRTTPGSGSIAERQLTAWEFPTYFMDDPWIEVPNQLTTYDVIIHRSPRYHNPHFPWKMIVDRFKGRIGMVGTFEEYKTFVQNIGPVEYVTTTDFLQLAKVIKGCKLFIGNQSAPYAVAEGLKHDTIQETCTPMSDCIFPRDNAWYIVDHKFPKDIEL